jgi:hypothetical protein
MTDGADVDVRLVAFELLLRHWLSTPSRVLVGPPGRRTRET